MHEYVNGNEEIAKNAKLAIENGEIHLLGKFMHDAQVLFDRCALPNCPSELTAPKLHEIMNDPFVLKESLAVKGVGSQGDGSAQILCENETQQTKVR
jgi:galactokinase